MNEIAHGKFGIGAPLRRKEDSALITGRGRFTDDVQPEGQLQAFILRSPYAHATFTISVVSAAQSSPGVHLVLTAKDVAHLNALPTQTPVTQPDGTKSRNRDIPVLCDGIVRHVGDAVACIVADSVALARDAAELIEIEWETLDAAVETATALEPGTPLVYDDQDSNLAFTGQMGDRAKADSVFAKAARVSELTIVNNRLVCNYMETRACIAEWVASEDRWSVFVGSQGVHGMQSALSKVMGVGRDKIRVRTGDVGGGFGTKSFNYREYPLVLEAAKRLGRPVKWICERTEHFLADAHGRDNVTSLRMAMDENGRFLALEVDMLAAMGAYLHQYGPFIPMGGITMSTGVYDIPVTAIRVRGVFTHTTPTDAYRGAGRPEAAYAIERLVDKCAMDTGISREEIRRRNFIRPEQMPYTTPGRRMYDNGEFDGHMTLALERAAYDSFPARAAEAKKRGRVRGIGFATYIEACAFAGSEPAYLELKEDGRVTLKIGTQTKGQGHATAYAQMAGSHLGLDYELIELRQGDTDELARGGGTGGSRSIPVGGLSVVAASEVLAKKLKKLAADDLEASPEDIELVDGTARIAGTDRIITFADIAKKAKDKADLLADADIRQTENTYPNGTHVVEVEIDPETGMTELVTYTIVDDFGVTVNPLLLQG
ncbi:MAG TPA: xanthine dehydrogenase family protein molybdopterin-binding subunit, partial [Rhizobiaceae bacterium]|nr:xanthine dehydrogenase family protein molybdopterin-binding subunit [Rhizobiaceae bacterium]